MLPTNVTFALEVMSSMISKYGAGKAGYNIITDDGSQSSSRVVTGIGHEQSKKTTTPFVESANCLYDAVLSVHLRCTVKNDNLGV